MACLTNTVWHVLCVTWHCCVSKEPWCTSYSNALMSVGTKWKTFSLAAEWGSKTTPPQHLCFKHTIRLAQQSCNVRPYKWIFACCISFRTTVCISKQLQSVAARVLPIKIACFLELPSPATPNSYCLVEEWATPEILLKRIKHCLKISYLLIYITGTVTGVTVTVTDSYTIKSINITIVTV